MEPGELGFSVDMRGVDREGLLSEAARELDARQGHLGGEGGTPATPEGELVRELRLDRADLSYPEVHRIADADYLARSRTIPATFAELTRSHRFYWVRFPVGVVPRRNWRFNRLELEVRFHAAEGPHLTPKVYHVLPNKRFETLLELSDSVEVRLDEKFELDLKPGRLGPVDAEVGGALNAGVRLSVGPFTYRIRKAKIDHSGTGLEWVFWRLDGAEFFEDNVPEFVVVAQVPAETRTVRVSAALQAYRYFNFGSADLQDAVRHIPEALRGFFRKGLPLRAEGEYDLTPRL